MSSPTDAASSRVRLSLRSKLIRTMIGTLSVVAAAVLATVSALHVWTVRDTLSLVEAKIRESIIRKGQGLVANHAQALPRPGGRQRLLRRAPAGRGRHPRGL